MGPGAPKSLKKGNGKAELGDYCVCGLITLIKNLNYSPVTQLSTQPGTWESPVLPPQDFWALKPDLGTPKPLPIPMELLMK